jgi:hypothetical protein
MLTKQLALAPAVQSQTSLTPSATAEGLVSLVLHTDRHAAAFLLTGLVFLLQTYSFELD